MAQNKDKVVIFEQFAKKAKERLEERKKLHKEELVIGSMGGMTMEIRGVSDTELNEVFEFSEDAIEIDRYLIYYASSTLQEAARIMVQQGALHAGQEYKITEMFSATERSFIANRILVLSGARGDADIRIREQEEIKNS